MNEIDVVRVRHPRAEPTRLGVAGSILVWAVPITVLVLLLGTAWASGSLGTDLLVFNLIWVVTSSGAVGALLATRRPGNAVGWLLWFSGSSLGLTLAASYYVTLSVTLHDGTLPGTLAAACYSAWSGSLGLIAAFGVVPLIFPNGRPLPGVWRWVLVVVVFEGVMSVLADVTRAGSLIDGYAPLNPLGITDGPVPIVGGLVQDLGGPLVALVALLSVVARYRRGDPIERQQLRWFAAAVVVAIVGLAILLFAPEQLATTGFSILIFALGLVPLVIGIAILRYRLYEIDRIVSRTIGWTLTTGLVAAVFGLLIVGLQALLAPVTSESTLVVAGSTLVAAALFMPLHRRLQAAVDRRFNRSRVDAQRALEAFGVQLRDEVDLDAVSDHVVGVATQTVQPQVVGLWMRPGGAAR